MSKESEKKGGNGTGFEQRETRTDSGLLGYGIFFFFDSLGVIRAFFAVIYECLILLTE